MTAVTFLAARRRVEDNLMKDAKGADVSHHQFSGGGDGSNSNNRNAINLFFAISDDAFIGRNDFRQTGYVTLKRLAS